MAPLLSFPRRTGIYACAPTSSGMVESLEQRVMLAVDVSTWHYDNARLGVNDSETELNLGNVNSSAFGKLFSFQTDGQVYAQPLLQRGVDVPGYGIRDLLLVATEHDSLYAFDANGDNPAEGYLWKRSFLTGPTGTTVTPVPDSDVGIDDITPEIGITGTPVIDPATGTLYVVAKTKEVTDSSTSYVQRLYAVDLSTGSDVAGGSIEVSASIAGTGDGGDTITFDPLTQHQRAALALVNGIVYIAWASHGDNGVYHGWVMGYNASDITQQVAVYCNTPNGEAGGIWMSAGGISADSDNNLYVASGNGTFNADTGGSDYGSSALKVSTVSGPSVADFFTPYNQADLSAANADFGVSSVLVLPDQGGTHPSLLVVADKGGRIYLLDQTSMGGFDSTQNNDLSEVDIGNTLHNNFAFFSGMLYVAGDGGHLTAYPIVDGQFGAAASSSAETFGTNDSNGSGGSPVISANGTSDAIVWISDNSAYGNGPAVLRAYDATDLSSALYDSTQAAGGRDTADIAVKFVSPMVANGKVYLAGNSSVTVYGLLPAAPTAPDAPTGLTAQADGSDQITLSWTAPAGSVTSYNIYRSTNPGGEGTTPYMTGITGTSFTDTGLTADTTYYYTVSAVSDEGDSAQSNEASAHTAIEQLVRAYQFTTGSRAPTLTHMGIRGFYHESGTRTVELLDAATGAVLASVEITLSGRHPGKFVYAKLGSPVALEANHSYIVRIVGVSAPDTVHQRRPAAGEVRLAGYTPKQVKQHAKPAKPIGLNKHPKPAKPAKLVTPKVGILKLRLTRIDDIAQG